MRLLQTIRADLIKQQEVVRLAQQKLDLLANEYSAAIEEIMPPIPLRGGTPRDHD